MNKALQKTPLSLLTAENKPETDAGNIFDGSLPVNITKKESYLAKQIIYREADAADKIYYIRGGMVKMLSHFPNGRQRIVRLHVGGHWLGLEGLVGQPYGHSAITLDDVEVDCFSVKDILQLQHDDIHRYVQILSQVYMHLKQADRWIVDLSTGSIKIRVANLLEFLSTLEYGQGSSMVELLTVNEMADMLGVTPESVSRILAEFKRNDTLHKVNRPHDEVYRINTVRMRSSVLQ